MSDVKSALGEPWSSATSTRTRPGVFCEEGGGSALGPKH